MSERCRDMNTQGKSPEKQPKHPWHVLQYLCDLKPLLRSTQFIANVVKGNFQLYYQIYESIKNTYYDVHFRDKAKRRAAYGTRWRGWTSFRGCDRQRMVRRYRPARHNVNWQAPHIQVNSVRVRTKEPTSKIGAFWPDSPDLCTLYVSPTIVGQ